MTWADDLSRRRLLRGAMKGGMVAVGLPLLDMFLDGNGAAMASGRPLPQRFGTWYWGLGLTRSRWEPKTIGANYDIPIELKPLEKFRDRMSVLSNYRIELGGLPNLVHFSGNCSIRTGAAPAGQVAPAASFETAISRQIGKGARFRSIDVSCTGAANDSYSWDEGNVLNPAEVSPASLYRRLFGGTLQNTANGAFKPDPQTMAMHSVLSAVQDGRERLLRVAGAADRQRLDQYFTSIREVEEQVAVELQKPVRSDNCQVVKEVPETQVGTDVEWAQANHKLFTDLILMAVACDQTRAFNIVYSRSASNLRRKGVGSDHHVLSHEEPVDNALGYQPSTTWFVEQSMIQWANFLEAASTIKEGDGTLLDNMIVFAHSDCETARVHSIDGIPMMIAGTGGGRIKTGVHVAGNGDLVTRVGLTLQQALGVPVGSWGIGPLESTRPISELMV